MRSSMLCLVYVLFAVKNQNMNANIFIVYNHTTVHTTLIYLYRFCASKAFHHPKQKYVIFSHSMYYVYDIVFLAVKNDCNKNERAIGNNSIK